MPREYADYLLCRFIRAADRVEGRIRMQKATFLLAPAGLRLFQDYFFHLRGPYSPALANTMGELVDQGLLKEDREELSPEFFRYDYQLSPLGGEVIDAFESHPLAVEAKELGDAHEARFVDLARRDVRQLELASSLLYWRDLGYDWDETLAMTAAAKRATARSPEMLEARALAEELAGNPSA